MSGVLHVDLINTGNKIDQSIKLQIDSGVAWGDFALPDSLPKGNYRVRAYTQWMRNNGDADFFDKTILIGSAKAAKVPENMVRELPSRNLKPDVQFFPEGGTLVAGIRSKIAYKVIGPNGLGIETKGAVIDNDDNQVTSFASAHLGMGYFGLMPVEGKTYSAKIIYPDGAHDIILLPKPEKSGVVLSVNNDSLPNANIKIEASANYYQANKNKDYTLVIYSQGTATTVNCKLDSPIITLDIIKRKLHTGVATATLFSAESEPISERLFFVQNYDQLNININTDKTAYSKREKVAIKLNALNRKGDGAEGHFSAVVVDESKVPEGQKGANNILSYLLLTTDLKGYIEQPGYYFADNSVTVRNNLDILMLTQGYRRFEWKEVLKPANQPLAYQPEKGIEIKGQVTNLFNKPTANGDIRLISPKGGPIISGTTDSKGIYHFSNLNFTDTAHFVLSAVNKKGRNSTKITWFTDGRDKPEVHPDRQEMPVVPDTILTAYTNNDKLQRREVMNYGKGKGIMLKQVNIKDKKIDDQYHTESLAGAGHADQVMHAEEIEQIPGLLSTSLDGRLRGIVFTGHNPLHKVPYLKIGGTNPMLVIIDGAEVSPDALGTLTASQVETVEVLKYASASIYGMAGAGGVLIITTKRGGGLTEKDIASIGVLPIAPMGFYKARQFYSPKYDNATWVGRQKDLRSTIFWKPEIKTDKDGNAGFEYYNADGTGTYKVIVEGIDNNGNIGRQVFTYKVE